MDEVTLSLLTKLAPGLMEEISARALVLERVSVLQPVGRRALAQRLQMPEREARVITDSMREDGLIEVSTAGMLLTDKAYQLLDSVREMVRARLGIASLEVQLQRLLKVGRVCIVPSDPSQPDDALAEVGRAAGAKLKQVLKDGMTLAVTGGTTIQQVAKHIPHGAPLDVTVLPARGGLGSSVETQASTLAEEIANRLGGHHRALYLPDSLTADALKELYKLKEISEPLEALKHTDVLLYGVARADDMAKNRLMPKSRIGELLHLGATAEVLGYCFDSQGKMLEAASGLGLDITSIDQIPVVMAVAAGARKAEAILAVTRHHKHDYLIIDECAAHALTELLKRE